MSRRCSPRSDRVELRPSPRGGDGAPAAPFDDAALEERFTPLVASVRSKLEASGFEPGQMHIERFADTKFTGQFYEAELGFGEGDLPTSDALVRLFHERYDQVYGEGAGLRSAGVEIVNVRVVGEGRPDGLVLPEVMADTTSAERAPTMRRMYWPTIDTWAEAPVRAAADLRPGSRLEGSAVVEGAHTSIVVHPGDHGRRAGTAARSL